MRYRDWCFIFTVFISITSIFFGFIGLHVFSFQSYKNNCKHLRVCNGENTCISKPSTCDSYNTTFINQNPEYNCPTFFRNVTLFTEHNEPRINCTGNTCNLLEGCYKWEIRQNMFLYKPRAFYSYEATRNGRSNMFEVSIGILIFGFFLMGFALVIRFFYCYDNRIYPVANERQISRQQRNRQQRMPRSRQRIHEQRRIVPTRV